MKMRSENPSKVRIRWRERLTPIVHNTRENQLHSALICVMWAYLQRIMSIVWEACRTCLFDTMWNLILPSIKFVRIGTKLPNAALIFWKSEYLLLFWVDSWTSVLQAQLFGLIANSCFSDQENHRDDIGHWTSSSGYFWDSQKVHLIV